MLVTACGADDEGSGAGGGRELDVVKVGIVPTLTKADFYLGIERGFFAEQNIKPEPQVIASTAATTAAVTGGDVMVASGGTVPLLVAETQNVPVRIIAPGTSSSPPKPGEEYTYAQLLVPKDSGVRTAKDLEGKRIGVTGLKSALPLALLGAAERVGADPSKFKLVAADLPDLVPAVESGRVDAIVTIEPFTQHAQDRGFRTVLDLWPFEGEFVTSSWFTSAETLEKNRDVLQRFLKALDKAHRYGQQHPDEMRAVVPAYIPSITPETASKVTMEQFVTELNMSGLEKLADLMMKFDYVPRRPSLQKVVADVAPTNDG